MSSSNYSTYNIPSSWAYITYSGGYYYYRVGSIQADGSASRTISYTAATAMTKLSAPTASVAFSKGSYVLTIRNSNSQQVMASVSWYNSSGSSLGGPPSFKMSANTTSTSTTLSASSVSAAYAIVSFSATGCISASTTTNTCSRATLSAPELLSSGYEYNTNGGDTSAEYDYQATMTVKNNNDVTVYCVLSASGHGTYTSQSGQANTIAPGSHKTIWFAGDAGASFYVQFAATGYNSSSETSYAIPGGSSGGGGGGETTV
jgi:hypothetical protein